MSFEQLQTFASNAAHAARSRQSVQMGGGEFKPDELKAVAAALNDFESMVKAFQEISEMLQKHPDFEKGNSVVHYCAHKAAAACSAYIDNDAQSRNPSDKPRG